MGHCSCGVLVPPTSGVLHRFDHCGFMAFICGSYFDSSVFYLAYLRSVETNWSSVDGVLCWSSFGFVDGRGHDLAKVAPGYRREMRVGRLVCIDSMLLELSSEQYLLWTAAAWQAFLHSCARNSERILYSLTHIVLRREFLMLTRFS